MRRLVTTQTRDVLVRRRLRHRIQRERGDASTERDLIVRRTKRRKRRDPGALRKRWMQKRDPRRVRHHQRPRKSIPYSLDLSLIHI